MAISKRKIGSLVPCPTCQTMIEVPGVDMATVAKAENRGKGLEKGAGQPLLEEDFDQVIARSDDPGANKNEQHIEAELIPTPLAFGSRMMAILVFAGVVLFLSGLVLGLLIARIWSPQSG